MTSTVPGFLQLVGHDNAPVSSLKWAEEYESTYPAVFETYYDGFSHPSRRGVWANARSPVELRHEVRSAEERALEIGCEVEAQLVAAGLLDGELDVVLVVGNRTSNAWVANLHGVATVFVALELLPAPPYDSVALLHEAIHVAHVRRGGHGWPEDVASALFEEGLATAASRLLHPGLTDSEYGWVDDAHQGWAAQCENLLPGLACFALDHLQEPSEGEAGDALFAGDGLHEALPLRAGYWLGDFMLRDLVDSYALTSLLSWNHDRATEELHTRLTSLATR